MSKSIRVSILSALLALLAGLALHAPPTQAAAATQSPVGIFGGAPTFAQLPGNYSFTITASAAGAASATLTNAWPYATTSTAICVWSDGESRTCTLTSAATTMTWTTNIATSGSGLTIVVDGQTTVPGAGTAGFTSDFGPVASNGTLWTWGVLEPGPAAVIAQVLTGCATITAVSGTPTTLRFTSTATTCNPQLLLPYSANGWSCFAQDVTSGHSVVYTQTATATNGCTVTATTTSGDTTLIKAFPIP